MNNHFRVDPAVLIASINEVVYKFGSDVFLVRNAVSNLAVMLEGEHGEFNYLGFISTAFGNFEGVDQKR